MRSPMLTAALALCLAAGAAGAQTPSTPTPAQPDSGMMRDSAMRGGTAMQADTASLVGQVQQVVEAARAGLTSVPAATARTLVSSIESKLRATGRASLRSIANDLRALDRELGMSEVSGRRVGVILRRVGPKVTAVAAGQTGAVRTTLRELGSQLTSAGRQLAASPAAAGR